LQLSRELRFVLVSAAIMLGCFLGGALLWLLISVITGGEDIWPGENWPLELIPPSAIVAALSLAIAFLIRGRVRLLFPFLAVLAGFVLGPIALVLIYIALFGGFNGD
jgi:hypothetical protein